MNIYRINEIKTTAKMGIFGIGLLLHCKDWNTEIVESIGIGATILAGNVDNKL